MPRSNRSKLHPTDEFASNEIIDQLNIRYRVCHVFTSSASNKKQGDEDVCKCGLKREQHTYTEFTDKQWDVHTNTLEKINPRYGPTPNHAYFARLAIDTPFAKVERILLDAWKLPRPRFIVSIIGGAKYFRLSDRLETGFINGIVEIAQKSDAWLLTNGYNTGIVQLVGQAIRKVRYTKLDKKTTAIGICKWGCISDVEYITGQRKLNLDRENQDEGNERRRKKKRVKGESELEMNHSHYLMIDDGTVHEYDLGDYRTRLAIHMARLEQEDDIVIPAVTLVVEGGKETITNVYYDLRKNVPVVLVAGSGRAADFLARWLIYTNNLDFDNEHRMTAYSLKELNDVPERDRPTKYHAFSAPEPSHNLDFSQTILADLFQQHQNLLEEDVKNNFFPTEKSNSQSVKQLTKQILYCLQPAVRSDITIFDISSDDNLSETILRSICQSRQKLSKRKMNDEENNNHLLTAASRETKSRRKDVEEQHLICIKEKEERAERTRLLQLAMDWGCIDVAKEFIFQSSIDNILNKNEMFLSALKRNLPLFVYEFLKLKINLRDIFFRKSDVRKGYQYKTLIQELYTVESVNRSDTHLKHFIRGEEDDLKKIRSVTDLNDTLNLLVGDYMHDLYYDSFETEFEDRLDKGLIEQDRTLSDDDIEQIRSECILRDLFLWSILMNYIQMAIIVLSFMKYRLCPTLIATKILKQYYKKAPYGDLKRRYKSSATYFEDYASDCLTRCYELNSSQACEIILQRNELYGYITCLQVASDADDKPFLAHPCCAEAVRTTWYDKLDSRGSNAISFNRFFIGFISLGILAPFIVPYRTTKEKPSEHREQKLRNNGINYSDPKQLEYQTPPADLSAIKRYFRKFYKFHLSLPTRFCFHLLTYIFFLLLFSYYLLFNFNPPTDEIPSIHWTEILTIILVSFMLIEELRYFVSQENVSWLGKWSSYIDQHVKKMILVGFILFYIGLALRFTETDQTTNFNAARVVLAIDLEIWWLRSLWFIMVFPFIGPHLVSIGKMIRDMIFFMCIIVIVMTAYGVASRAMVYYPEYNGFTEREENPVDNRFDGRSVFRFIAYPVYFMLYGEIEGELNSLDGNKNAGWSIATHVLLAIHMMFVNVLLINLLIAMFSKRFEEVSDDIQNIWHSQQYILTREYYTRAPFFPPINYVYDVYYFGKKVFYYCRRKMTDKPDDSGAHVFQMIPKKVQLIREWLDFEEGATFEYAHDAVKTYESTSEKTLLNSSSSSSKEKESITKKTAEENSNTIDGLKNVEEQLTSLNTLVEEMRESLKKNN